ncbi:MAG: septal ring lytic transglycosylase RlpA family protein [Gammaproteobacteria bacterium]|nr:septal ring lytic transglycosylase RlpA family protein [Gammaproteobacteria bacterium]
MEYFLRIISVILIVDLLVSCSSVPQDGPPRYDIDISQIKNAVPKVLPKSPYGNPKEYVVNGETYHVLPTARDYKATGIASWYGTQFDHHRASDGEMYDMCAMTAAHKTLPIPCFVRVTNLANNRSVIVKVIDRGPFEQGRIIDLSYVAAKKLGIIEKGTGSVKVEAINPRTWQKPASEQKSVSNTKGDIKKYVQAGSYVQRFNAVLKRDQLLKTTKYPVTIEPVQLNHKTLYRVKIGPIDAADSYLLLNPAIKHGIARS